MTARSCFVGAVWQNSVKCLTTGNLRPREPRTRKRYDAGDMIASMHDVFMHQIRKLKNGGLSIYTEYTENGDTETRIHIYG